MKKLSNIIFIFILLATSLPAFLAFPQKTEAVGIPNWLEATVETLTPDAIYVSEKTYVQNGGDLGENQCWSFTSGIHLGNCLRELTRWFIKVLVEVAAFIARLANIVFSVAIYLSIRQFSTFVDSIDAIDLGWKIIRDLMNLLFIGSLFYIAINTILQTSKAEWKRDVPKIIIAALLINFSMLFTKIMIDASNLMTITFYDNSASVNGTPQYVRWFGSTENLDLGAGPIPDISTQITSIMVDHKIDKLNTRQTGVKKTLLQEAGPSLGKIVLLGVTAFVLLTAAILFIIRTVVLIFLLISSPFAFIGLILPKGQQFASQWWKNLTDQLLFAPAYMLCFFIVIQMATASSNIKTAFGSASDTYGAGTLMLFIILTGMMFACIFVAKSMGAKGAQWAQQTAGGALAAPIARFSQETMGRMAARRAEKLRGQLQDPNLDPAKRARLESQLVRADKLSKATFDIRNTKSVQTLGKVGGADFGKGTDKSFAKRRADKEKEIKDAAKSLAPQTELEKKEAKDRNEAFISDPARQEELARLKAALPAAEATITASQEYRDKHGNALNDNKARLNAEEAQYQVREQKLKADQKELADRKRAGTLGTAQEEALKQTIDQQKSSLEEDKKKNATLSALKSEETRLQIAANKYKQEKLSETAVGKALGRLDARGTVDNKKLDSLSEEDRKKYLEEQTKKKKHFESGGYAQEQYAQSVATGAAGSFYVPFTNTAIPFTSDNPLASKRDRDTYAAAVKKQGGGESDEDAFIRIATKLEKERAAKEGKKDETPATTPTTPPSTP